MAKLKVLTVFGTRPEAIKMAPVVRELRKHPGQITSLVAVTAQHRDMLDQVLHLFEIVPDYDLDIMSQGQTLVDITCRAMRGLQEVMEKEKPDLVLVHGDTTTTLAGALTAFYQQIPVGHVEAGLRTRQKYSPFPEELNRTLTGSLTEWHFAPTSTAQKNLLDEGILPQNIFVTGNTVIDALQETVHTKYLFADRALNELQSTQKKVILVTTHRRENLGEPMRQVYQALKRLLEEFGNELELVFPVHKNPRVRKIVKEELGSLEGIHLIEPLNYEPFANLMALSYLVVTDSGGIQEEAPALGKPVLVLRDTTERPEAVKAGTVQLVGTEYQAVYESLRELVLNPDAYNAMAGACNPYGDGKAAERIVQTILWKYGFRKQPASSFSCGSR